MCIPAVNLFCHQQAIRLLTLALQNPELTPIGLASLLRVELAADYPEIVDQQLNDFIADTFRRVYGGDCMHPAFSAVPT